MSLTRLNSIKNKLSNISIKVNGIRENLKLPEKYKGTVIEKWANYWRLVGKDYKEVGDSLVTSIRDKPRKAAIYAAAGLFVYYCGKKNPDHEAFITDLRRYHAEMCMVSEQCLRPESPKYLKFLEQCENQGLVRRLTLGIISFLWLADYDESVSLYKAVCPYLEPEYATFHKRIIDIGFWDTWWILRRKMLDYDVNFD